MPFALNVLIATVHGTLGLRTLMVSGELKMDRHSKTLSTPDLSGVVTKKQEVLVISPMHA